MRRDLARNLNHLNSLKQGADLDPELFQSTVRNLLFSYSPQRDAENLSVLSHFFIRHKELICSLIDNGDSTLCKPQSDARPDRQANKSVSSQRAVNSPHNQWLYRLKKLILLNLQYLYKLMFNDSVQQSSNFVPLRLLEVFTSPEFYAKNCRKQDVSRLIKSIWNFLVQKNYFVYMRKIIETKVPVPYDDEVPHTPMERTIYELTVRPLNIELSETLEDRTLVRRIIVSFFREYLAGPFSPIIKFHVFKLINEKLPKLLHFACLSGVLKEASILTTGVNGPEQTEIDHRHDQTVLPADVWTLYALLSISTNQIEDTSFKERLVYLFYVKSLIQHLPNQLKFNEEEEESDGEDDIMEHEGNIEQLERNLIANDTVRMLNSLPNVNCFNSMLKMLNEENVHELLSFSTIGYSLLINNKTTIYENRLLYTLAFNSTFLRQLWKYIITITSAESTTLLIQQISKGIFLNEWKLILPHLSFFCSLFNYLLPTNDDFEFCEDKSSDQKKKFSTMPFSLNELRSMVVILRDVSLGLIELGKSNFFLLLINSFNLPVNLCTPLLLITFDLFSYSVPG